MSKPTDRDHETAVEIVYRTHRETEQTVKIKDALSQARAEAREETIKECAEIAKRNQIFYSGHAGDWDHGAFKTAQAICTEILNLLKTKPTGESKP